MDILVPLFSMAYVKIKKNIDKGLLLFNVTLTCLTLATEILVTLTCLTLATEILVTLTCPIERSVC